MVTEHFLPLYERKRELKKFNYLLICSTNIKSLLMNIRILILLLLFPSLLMAQEQITGKVIDGETNETIIGATILIKGTNTGTITDLNGNFSIEAKPGQVLVISSIGYKDVEVNIESSKSNYNITLMPDFEEIEEIVVVGYGTMKKSDLTGAIVSVKSDEINKSGGTSIQDALSGRVAGLQVTSTDGSPGGNSNIIIRGGNSIMNDNRPLYVVDGMQMVADPNDPADNPIGFLNPRDIESIEVLKDASATAIYGAEGANGVIIITTKKGKEGKTTIDFYYRGGMSIMDRSRVQFLTPEEYSWLMVDKRNLGGFDAVEWDKPENFDLFEKIYAEKLYNDIAVDWLDEITQYGVVHDVGASLRGGEENTTYSFSTGYYNEQGVVVNSSYQRLYNNFAIDRQLTDKLKLGTKINFSYTGYDGLIENGSEDNVLQYAIYTSPFLRFFQNPENYSALSQSFNEEEVQSDWLLYVKEPARLVNEQINNRKRLSTNGVVNLNYNIAKGLSLFGQFNYNLFFQEANQFIGYNGAQDVTSAKRDKLQNNNYAWQGRINYNKGFKGHNFGIMGVFEGRIFNSELERLVATGATYNPLGYYDYTLYNTTDIPAFTYRENTSIAAMSRLTYSYEGKYLFTGTFRADASSRFSPENRWGYFPSASVAWSVHRESFFDNINIISMLKFRLGYGETGNNRTDDYAFRNLVSPVRYVNGTNIVPGLGTSQFSNSSLKWETTSEWNAGLDFGFNENRLSGSLEVYNRTSRDVILEVQVPKTSGYESKFDNVGVLNNKGIELTINAHLLEIGYFKWNTGFSISANRSLVVDLGEKSEYFFSRNFVWGVGNDVLLREGLPVGVYYGYMVDGVNNSVVTTANDPRNTVSQGQLGQLRLVDFNYDGVVNEFDKVPIGYTQPLHTGGISNNFEYKNLDLSVFLRWSYGNDVMNGNIRHTSTYRGVHNILNTIYQENWSQENPYATYHGYQGVSNPTWAQYGNGLENVMSSIYVEDGSYLRLDNVTLGYTLPQNMNFRLRTKSFRIYIMARNLFVLTRYSWFDPEVSTGWGTAAMVGPGADAGSYPKSRHYQIGLDITF